MDQRHFYCKHCGSELELSDYYAEITDGTQVIQALLWRVDCPRGDCHWFVDGYHNEGDLIDALELDSANRQE